MGEHDSDGAVPVSARAGALGDETIGRDGIARDRPDRYPQRGYTDQSDMEVT